jgi:hypothetical protein
MGKQKPARKKPRLIYTRELPDGSKESKEMSWEEAYGSDPPSVQALIEHNYLHNQILLRESDRAAAVLAPAYLDALLEDLLRSFFIEGDSADQLLGLDRPIGTFSSRIDLAHAVGFVTDDTRHDLHLIRKIRNDFAHKVDLHSFDGPPIRDRCAQFRTPKLWDRDCQFSEPGQSRMIFLFTVWKMVGDIVNGMRYVKRRQMIERNSKC